jgi:hypothetical protein
MHSRVFYESTIAERRFGPGEMKIDGELPKSGRVRNDVCVTMQRPQGMGILVWKTSRKGEKKVFAQ